MPTAILFFEFLFVCDPPIYHSTIVQATSPRCGTMPNQATVKSAARRRRALLTRYLRMIALEHLHEKFPLHEPCANFKRSAPPSTLCLRHPKQWRLIIFRRNPQHAQVRQPRQEHQDQRHPQLSRREPPYFRVRQPHRQSAHRDYASQTSAHEGAKGTW